MLDCKCTFNWLKMGLVVLALTVGACGGGASSTGTGGTGGHAGSGGGAGAGGGGGGSPDGGNPDAALTPRQQHDMLINAATTGGLQVTTAAPTVTYPTCQ